MHLPSLVKEGLGEDKIVFPYTSSPWIRRGLRRGRAFQTLSIVQRKHS